MASDRDLFDAQPLDYADCACQYSAGHRPAPDGIVVWGRGPDGSTYRICVPPEDMRDALRMLDGLVNGSPEEGNDA